MPYLCHHTFRSAPRHSWKSMCVIGTGTVAHTHAQSGRTRTGHEAESQAGLAEWGLSAPIQAIHYTRSVVRVQLCNGARRPRDVTVAIESRGDCVRPEDRRSENRGPGSPCQRSRAMLRGQRTSEQSQARPTAQSSLWAARARRPR